MINFEYYSPTKVYFGKNREKEVGSIIKKLKKMHKIAHKILRLSMLAFLEGRTELKDDIMELEESIHILQSKSINLIAEQMAESSFDEKERSNYFIYLFRK